MFLAQIVNSKQNVFMSEVHETIQRLESLFPDRGWKNKADFYQSFGIGSQVYNNWRKRGIPGKQLIKVARFMGVSSDWLATGHGEMVPSEARLGAKMPPLKSHIAASSHDELVSQIPFDPTGLTDSQRELFEAIIQSLPTMDDDTAGALKTIAMNSSKTKSRK